MVSYRCFRISHRPHPQGSSICFLDERAAIGGVRNVYSCRRLIIILFLKLFEANVVRKYIILFILSAL